MSPEFLDFVFHWKELIGAFGGSSLAILLSGIGFLIVRGIDKAQEHKENLRRIEVASTYSLNSILTMQEKLRFFVASLRQLAHDVQSITNPKEFALQTVNFPSLGSIYLDDELPKFRVNSYYLHNKILWVHAGTQDVNGVLNGLKDDFLRVIKLNETMIQLMGANPNPPAQRASYAMNIGLFADGIQKFATTELNKGIKPLTQLKVYNDKLRQPYGIGTLTRWKYEGGPFRFIYRKLGLEKIPKNLKNIDRIDAEIEGDVQKSFDEVAERARQLGQTFYRPN